MLKTTELLCDSTWHVKFTIIRMFMVTVHDGSDYLVIIILCLSGFIPSHMNYFSALLSCLPCLHNAISRQNTESSENFIVKYFPCFHSVI